MKKTIYLILGISLLFTACTKDELPTPISQSSQNPIEVIPEFTSIPDPAFENILIAKGLDNVLDGRIRTQNAINYTDGLDLKNTNLNNTGILDMTGIQAFKNIIWLNVTDNRNLKVLDVTKNTKLVSLTTSNTDISTLDLSYCTELTDANLQNLETLPEYGVNHTKGLISVNLNNCFKLQKLYLIGNRLKTINVSHLSNLTNLWLQYNELEGDLNLSGLSKLDVIFVNNNKLSTLNIKGTNNNGLPRTCKVDNNPNLTQVKVTNLQLVINHTSYLASINNIWWLKDNHTTYVQ